MEIIFKFTLRELQIISKALHIGVIHIEDEEEAQAMNNLLTMIRPLSGA